MDFLCDIINIDLLRGRYDGMWPLAINVDLRPMARVNIDPSGSQSIVSPSQQVDIYIMPTEINITQSRQQLTHSIFLTIKYKDIFPEKKMHLSIVTR